MIGMLICRDLFAALHTEESMPLTPGTGTDLLKNALEKAAPAASSSATSAATRVIKTVIRRDDSETQFVPICPSAGPHSQILQDLRKLLVSNYFVININIHHSLGLYNMCCTPAFD